MKSYEIINKLKDRAWDRDYTHTCDTYKAGCSDIDVDKVAVTMFATVDVIRQAKEWGAQLLITHEPTYYKHMDEHSDEKIENEKRKLIEDAGITIFRYHDYAHFRTPDIIATGMLDYMNLDGKYEYADIVRISLKEPTTAVELAKTLEKNLGIKHIRICGTRDAMCTNVSAMFGTPNGVFEELKREETEILITGEACEWSLCEYARDAAQLGYKKTLMVMGHIGSERDGMKLAAKWLKENFSDLEVKYFECGEVYTYTDSE